jgi:hypothetical protein
VARGRRIPDAEQLKLAFPVRLYHLTLFSHLIPRHKICSFWRLFSSANTTQPLQDAWPGIKQQLKRYQGQGELDHRQEPNVRGIFYHDRHFRKGATRT